MTGRDLATIVALGAIWGGSYLLIQIAAESFGALPLVAARVWIASGLLWAWLTLRRRPVRWRVYGLRLLVLGGLNAALPFGLVAVASTRIPASLNAMLGTTQALWGVLFGILLLRERLTARTALGLLFGTAGVGILVGWSPSRLDGNVVTGVLCALTATACYALGAVYTRVRLGDAAPETLALGQQVGAGIWLGAPAAHQAPGAVPSPPAMAALLALSLLCTAVAYILHFQLVQRVGPTRSNIVTFLIPLFGAVWGHLILAEPITPGMVGGLGAVLCSVALLSGEPQGSRPTAPLPRGMWGRTRQLVSDTGQEVALERPPDGSAW